MFPDTEFAFQDGPRVIRVMVRRIGRNLRAVHSALDWALGEILSRPTIGDVSATLDMEVIRRQSRPAEQDNSCL